MVLGCCFVYLAFIVIFTISFITAFEIHCKYRYYLDIINIYQGKIMRKIDRFLQYLEYKGITENKATIECGLAQGLLHQAKSGKSDLGAKTIDKILIKYQDLSREYLLTGEGEMLKPSIQTNTPIKKSGKESLPLIPIEAVAGFPTIDIEGVRLEDCEHYNVPDFIAKGAQYLIRVSGSSMYPKYSNGDILACRKIDSVTFFQWGKVYVLDTNQGALVKRLFEDKENKDNVICRSDNHANYPDFSVPKSEIRSLSIVIGVIRLD